MPITVYWFYRAYCFIENNYSIRNAVPRQTAGHVVIQIDFGAFEFFSHAA